MIRIFTSCLLLFAIVGCTTSPIQRHTRDGLYGTAQTDTLLVRYAPIIAPQQNAATHNRIGRVAAKYNNEGEEEVEHPPI